MVLIRACQTSYQMYIPKSTIFTEEANRMLSGFGTEKHPLIEKIMPEKNNFEVQN